MATPMQQSAAAAAVLKAVKGPYAPRIEQCDPFKTVGYNQKATLEFDVARTVQGLEFVSNLSVARISRISMEYQDGSEFFFTDPSFLIARDAYDKKINADAADSGVNYSRIYLDFADEQLRTTDGIRRGELAILPGEIIRVKVHIGAKQSGDPDAIELYANMTTTAAQADRYFVPRLSDVILSQTVTGEQTHKFPLMGINHRIRRMWLKTSKLTDFEIIRDRTKVMWGKVADIKAMVKRQTGKEAPAGWVCIDFISHGFASESAFIPVANESLQLKLKTTAAEEIPVYFEYITQNKEVPTGA
ncbi:major capsid protein P2 [Vibrio sp. HN007]|uniref:major capsid protein P2 n=1 Tax=Vibrio iocasae TaxID=3098914 RepID=UPI0035D48948